MSLCFGVFPGRESWHFATAEFNSPGDGPPQPKAAWDFRAEPNPSILPDGFWEWVGRSAASYSGQDPLAWCDDKPWLDRIRGNILSANLGELYYDHKNTCGEPNAIGVCHPHDTLPTVRRALPLLFDGKPGPSDGRPFLAAPPLCGRLDDGSRLVAVEAAIAGCLELASRGAVLPPANVLLLTGPAGSAELSAVNIASESNTLILQIVASRRLSPAHAASFPTPPGDGPLFVFGEHLTAVARQLTQNLKISASRVVYEPEQTLAAGAARYAAWVVETTRRAPSEGPPAGDELRVDHVCPWNIGLIGQGEGGAWFYHELFAAGDRLSTATRRIPVNRATVRELCFALRAGRPEHRATWLAQSEWKDYALRPWGKFRIEPSAEGGETVGIRLILPSGRLQHGWSLPCVDMATSPW